MPAAHRDEGILMALPETEKFRADKLLAAFCERRVPLHVRDQIRLLYNIEGYKVILIESRPVYYVNETVR